VRPLLAADEAERFDDEAARGAFGAVFSAFIKRIPGKPWARTAEMAEQFYVNDVKRSYTSSCGSRSRV
jgi:hypothetical protein